MKNVSLKLKIKLIKKEGINVPVKELSFLIFGPNQQGSTFFKIRQILRKQFLRPHVDAP